MHIITPHNPWAPKKKKTWQEELWEQQALAEFEARLLAEASSKTLPENAPETSLATAGPAVNAAAGGGGVPVITYFQASAAGPLDFSATVVSGIAPFSTTFSTSYPASLISSYRWIFGDGTTSTDPNPTHTYETSSTLYTASLQVTYSNGTAEVLAKNGYISASIPVLRAQFTYTTTSNVAPVTASFTNTSTYNGNGTLTYRWVFGDGTSSSLASPTAHPYTNSGSYTASLQVTESSYNNTSSYTQSFTKPAPTLTAAFTLTTSSKYNPSTATFLNTINGAGGTQYNGNGSLIYFWALGSGSLTAVTNIPTPTSYTVAGGYTASLAVTESSFGLTSYFTRSFYITQTDLSGLFLVTTSSNTAPATASYTASYVYTGSGTVSGYFDMGEGTQVLVGSTHANPVMIGSDTVGAFTATGSYTASLHLTESAAGLTYLLTQSFYLAAP